MDGWMFFKEKQQSIITERHEGQSGKVQEF